MSTLMYRMRDVSEVELAEANEGNMCAAYAGFGRWPDGELWATPATVVCLTGIPHPLFNGVFRPRLGPDTVDREIEATMAPFQRRGLPAYWWVGPNAQPTDLGARLEAHGLPYDGDVPGMAADLRTIPEPSDLPVPAGLTIERITNAETLERLGHVLCAAFGLPDEVGAAYVRGFAGGLFRAEPAWRHYVARLDGSPVATTSLLLAAGVAGIFNVGTVPEARRKGIAAALVATVLREARALGFGVGVLQASEAGYPLYERLGFRQCCTYRHHVWTAGDVPRH